MKVQCAHCSAQLDLADLSGRCPSPSCGSVYEVYYDRAEADRVAQVYNTQNPPAVPPAGVRKFDDANGWVVFFRDEGRLAEVAARILGGDH